MSRASRWTVVFAVTALGWPACSQTSTESPTPPIKAVAVTAAEGGTITVSSAESAQLAGTALVIPAGALAKDTVITLRVGAAPIVSRGQPIGPVAVWGPPGTVFAHEGRMTLPYQSAFSSARL